MATREKSWIGLLFICAGLVIGGLLGEVAKQVDWLSWLGYGQTFGIGIDTPFSITLNVLTLTFIQKQIPLNMQGRVSAFSTAIATISVAPGQLLFGQVIDMGVPLGVILIITAIFNIGLMLFIKWNVRSV
jgi:hypothetical protein